MATSGTVGVTKFDIDSLLTKAIRRCGLAPESLTPEIEENARSSLFMLLLALSNEGLNLWCVERNLLPVFPDRRTYALPIGTTDVLNLLFCVPSLVEHTDTIDAYSMQSDIGADTRIVRIGILLSSVPTAPLTVGCSSDGVTWTTVATIPVASVSPTGYRTWIDLDPPRTARYFKVSSSATVAVQELDLATNVREIPLTPYNRDDYANLPDKQRQSNFSSNYFFEKLMTPQLSLWPVPSDDHNHLSLFRYRQIQDVGDLTNELEIPPRWFESVCWHLALRLAFEIPSVDPTRRKEISSMADRYSIEAGSSEVDGSPVYIAPNIAPYTR